MTWSKFLIQTYQTRKRMHQVLSLALILAPLNFSCGAKTKTANEVRSSILFAQTLQDRLDQICLALRKDDFFVASKGELPQLNCGDAGVYAIDYSKSSAFYIRGFDAVEAGSDVGVEYINLRTQIWFEQTMLRIVGQIMESLREKLVFQQNGSTFDVSAISKDLENIQVNTDLLKMQAKLIGLPQVQLNPVRVLQTIEVVVIGIVPISLRLTAMATIRENGFVVVIKGNELAPDSFIKEFDAAIFLVPFANQTYIDGQVRLGMRSGGWGQVGANAVKELIDTSLKATVDDLLGFEAR